MRVVLLAGGLGTRLTEETVLKPKPMVEIGNRPILWHIMKCFHSFGMKDFIICCGYKGHLIKEYFVNYALHSSDITVNTSSNEVTIHQNNSEDWNVTLVDTGEATMTGGRLKRVERYLSPDEAFCLTYGDGLSDIDINRLIEFHNSQNKLATVTATRPAGRFGALKISKDGLVRQFKEKPDGDQSWINGGFFVLQPKVLDRINDDTTVWETEPLEGLAKDGELAAYQHYGFWQPMDTLREKSLLNQLWESGEAPWKTWA